VIIRADSFEVLCYFIPRCEIDRIVDGEELVQLKRLALFKRVLWKVSRLKFSKRFQKIVSAIKKKIEQDEIDTMSMQTSEEKAERRSVSASRKQLNFRESSRRSISHSRKSTQAEKSSKKLKENSNHDINTKNDTSMRRASILETIELTPQEKDFIDHIQLRQNYDNGIKDVDDILAEAIETKDKEKKVVPGTLPDSYPNNTSNSYNIDTAEIALPNSQQDKPKYAQPAPEPSPSQPSRPTINIRHIFSEAADADPHLNYNVNLKSNLQPEVLDSLNLLVPNLPSAELSTKIPHYLHPGAQGGENKRGTSEIMVIDLISPSLASKSMDKSSQDGESRRKASEAGREPRTQLFTIQDIERREDGKEESDSDKEEGKEKQMLKEDKAKNLVLDVKKVESNPKQPYKATSQNAKIRSTNALSTFEESADGDLFVMYLKKYFLSHSKLQEDIDRVDRKLKNGIDYDLNTIHRKLAHTGISANKLAHPHASSNDIAYIHSQINQIRRLPDQNRPPAMDINRPKLSKSNSVTIRKKPSSSLSASLSTQKPKVLSRAFTKPLQLGEDLSSHLLYTGEDFLELETARSVASNDFPEHCLHPLSPLRRAGKYPDFARLTSALSLRQVSSTSMTPMPSSTLAPTVSWILNRSIVLNTRMEEILARTVTEINSIALSAYSLYI